MGSKNNKVPEWVKLIYGDKAESVWYDMNDMEGERWESISEFDGYYEVSNLGRIKSIERRVFTKDGREWVSKARIMRQGLSSSKKPTKYFFVHFYMNDKGYTREVHRLVGVTFLEGGNDQSYILHNTTDTLDNRATNIRYDTPIAKAKQAWDIGSQKSASKGKFGADSLTAKPIVMMDMNGENIKTFPARIEAAKWLIDQGMARKQPLRNIMSAIKNASIGRTKFSYGHKWKDVIKNN